MPGTPAVSVVIPAYNNADYVEDAIESVLAQTCTDYELVIADHSSSDDTAVRIAKYADHPRVRVLDPTPAGGGALANWNRVSREARGEYLKLLCGDDLLEPVALERQVEALVAHPSAVLVASRRRLIDANGRTFLAARGLGDMDGLVPGRVAIRKTVRSGTNLFGEPGSVLFRTAALEQVGYWDASDPYLIDQATCVRVLHSGDLYAIRDVQASFRLTATQWSARLIDEQAQHAIEFHRQERLRHPDGISAADEVIGNLNVWRTVLMRRMSYAVLGAGRLERRA
jgi:glycosyltransferase involved in cell wall biosynthesis